MPVADDEDLAKPPAAPENTMPQFEWDIVSRLFSLGLTLDSACSIIGDGPAGDRIAAATDQVDRIIRDIRSDSFDLLAARSRTLQERLAGTARALQASAMDTVAMLERQASRTTLPNRLDYQVELKRWRDFADQAEQMAQRWEQPE
jgi:Fe2+ transport system protein FeoA